MLRHDTYLLHLYRSRAVSGWQWAARLEYLPCGESLRFNDSEALLAHLRALVLAREPSAPPAGTPPVASGPETTAAEGGTWDDA
jgi:hypothetical protein